MRSAGRRVPLEATCHEMAEMTYIRLQRAGQHGKNKERQERKREKGERERGCAASQMGSMSPLGCRTGE